MKQLSQLFVLSSISFISASQAATAPSDDVVIDVPAKHVTQAPTGDESRANRSPAVEPRVYVEDDTTGRLYYYDYPKQVSHAEQNPPKL
jgi:hypothetical protein